MADLTEISWLKPVAGRWLAAQAEGRLPHAVLLLGVPGVGKRALASWMAARRLGIGGVGDLPVYPVAEPEHADLHWLRPEEDRQGIAIDQVRDLVAELALTSYEGRGKVAVIEPADSMNAYAANALLKTLEEPPGDALIVLVADRVAGLPATIFSRCQRLTLSLPAEDEGMRFLAALEPADWQEALRAAGNAPLAALAMRERSEEAAAMSRDLNGIAEGRVSPLEAAARWTEREPGFVLGWLGRQVQQCILRQAGALPRPASVADSVLKRMDSRNLFCYLDSINRLRGQPRGSFSLQLALESLLIDWSRGLREPGRSPESYGL